VNSFQSMEYRTRELYKVGRISSNSKLPVTGRRRPVEEDEFPGRLRSEITVTSTTRYSVKPEYVAKIYYSTASSSSTIFYTNEERRYCTTEGCYETFVSISMSTSAKFMRTAGYKHNVGEKLDVRETHDQQPSWTCLAWLVLCNSCRKEIYNPFDKPKYSVIKSAASKEHITFQKSGA